MKPQLREYQNKAIYDMYNFFLTGASKGKVQISTGLGKTVIITLLCEKILQEYPNTSILILTSMRTSFHQFKSVFTEHVPNVHVFSHFNEIGQQGVLIATYQSAAKHKSDTNLPVFDLVICDDAQFMNDANCGLFVNHETRYLGILQNNNVSDGWFNDAECVFKYTTADALKDGHAFYTENSFVENFLKTLLAAQGFENIQSGVKIESSNRNLMLDITAEKAGQFFVLEVKSYRGLHNPYSIANSAMKQVMFYQDTLERVYQNKKFSFVIVLLCDADKSLKQNAFERHNISIWDIGNLIYLCNNDKKLLDLLAATTPYSIAGVKEERPFDFVRNDKALEQVPDELNRALIEFQNRLENCKPGRVDKSDKEYESICTDIIKYLFGTEFSQISEQHRTGDDLFRMDLLCSLKGSAEFWRFLIQFYSTKFVVFEYKNYSKPISQNLIYITEKYLFPAALRNVAFIISRFGFDGNAEKASMGCLKENGKLIVSLTDEDLIIMIAKKESGEEPSDFLLYKIEQLLMSVSK